MEKVTLKVDGMSCEHCVRAVTEAAGGLAGVSGVSVDLAGGTVSLEYDPAVVTLDRVKSEIEDQGYDVG
jgi:copper chaperone